jgi:hypothetical protein
MAILSRAWTMIRKIYASGRSETLPARSEQTGYARPGEHSRSISELLMLTFFFLTYMAMSFHSEANAESLRSSENAVKATFLYNFTKFVEWPEGAFESPESSIILCILGEDIFGEAVKVIENKTAGGRQLVIRYSQSVAEIGGCHVLFISASEKKAFPRILEALRGVPVLTVSDAETFTQHGGIIRFFREDNKIRFEINLTAAKAARLKISSRLLKLARIFKPK